jgi:photosystem II stability/assembly factor-like uncharacterized protein
MTYVGPGPSEGGFTRDSAIAITLDSALGNTALQVVGFTHGKGAESFESADGKTWKMSRKRAYPTSPLAEEFTLASPADAKVLYRSESDGLSRSRDGGRTWSRAAARVDGKDIRQYAISRVQSNVSRVWIQIAALHPTNPDILYAGVRVWSVEAQGSVTYKGIGGVLVSTNGGDDWRVFSDQLTHYENEELYSPPLLAISASDPATMISHGRNGIILTTDAGRAWLPVGQQDLLEAPPIMPERAAALERAKREGFQPNENPDWLKFQAYQAVFDPHNASTIYLVSSKGIYKSTDAGRTWVLLVIPVRNLFGINSLVIDRRDSNRLLVGAVNGAYLSKDGGAHFERVFPSPK